MKKFKYAEYYTFEDYLKEYNINENDITDETHFHYITSTWSIVFHRPYYRYRSHVYKDILDQYDAKGLYEEIVENFEKDIIVNYSYYRDKTSTKTMFIYYKNDKFVETEIFQSLLKKYNYALTYNRNKELCLDPYIPNKRTDYIYNDCKGIVYYATDLKTYEQIKKFGLKPKTIKCDKVRVSTCPDEMLLKIDLNKYHNTITFFEDKIKESNLFWTKEYIPPFCIEKIN